MQLIWWLQLKKVNLYLHWGLKFTTVIPKDWHWKWPSQEGCYCWANLNVMGDVWTTNTHDFLTKPWHASWSDGSLLCCITYAKWFLECRRSMLPVNDWFKRTKQWHKNVSSHTSLNSLSEKIQAVKSSLKYPNRKFMTDTKSNEQKKLMTNRNQWRSTWARHNHDLGKTNEKFGNEKKIL